MHGSSKRPSLGLTAAGTCLILVGISQLAIVPTSHASEDWKDGCPAYFPKESRPTYIPNAPPNSGVASFGALPELDSLLGSSRIALENWGSYIAPGSAPDGLANKMAATQGLVQLNLSSGPMFAVRYALLGYDFARDGNPGYLRAGDVQAFVGYRLADYLLGPLFRAGVAVRVGGGGALFDSNMNASVLQRERLAAISPFHSSSFGFDRPFGGTIEGRIELVGCQSAFLDLRVDVWTWQTGLANVDRIADVPMEIAGGAYLIPEVAIFGAIGLELRSPTSTLLFGEVARTSIGVDTQWSRHDVRIGARVGAFTGTNVTGFDASIVTSWHFPWGELP